MPLKTGFLVAVLLLLAPCASRGLAAAPLARSEKLPATTPWDLEQLSKPPAYRWADRQSPVRSLLYAGEPYRGRPTEVFAYYADPGTLAGDTGGDRRYPGIVLIHGGGGTAFREWAELWARRGYAAIAMDLAGSRPIEGQNPHARENRDRLPNGGPNQGDEEKFGQIDEPVSEQWPYHAVAAVLRAHSLLLSLPQVDAERTAVTGISWGGYLTSIVAGVDNRFRAAVPVYGCGFLHENSAWLDRLNRMTAEQRQRWIALWDPSQYLPAVSMPIFFVNGTNDFAYPLDSYMKSYDQVPGEKQLRITVNMPHGHPPGWAPPEIGLFIDQHLRGTEPLPQLGTPELVAGKLHLPYTSSTALKEASLHATTEQGPINGRSWQTVAAAVGATEITAPAPADATAWFLTATDQRGATVSTRVVIRADGARP